MNRLRRGSNGMRINQIPTEETSSAKRRLTRRMQKFLRGSTQVFDGPDLDLAELSPSRLSLFDWCNRSDGSSASYSTPRSNHHLLDLALLHFQIHIQQLHDQRRVVETYLRLQILCSDCSARRSRGREQNGSIK